MYNHRKYMTAERITSSQCQIIDLERYNSNLNSAETLSRGYGVRRIEEADIPGVNAFMSFWLTDYMQQHVKDPETLARMHELLRSNVIMLDKVTGGELPGHHFYIAEDFDGTIIGTAGFVEAPHMDANLKRALHKKGVLTVGDEIQFDLTEENVPELYFLYTHPGSQYRSRKLGRTLMDTIIGEAARMSGVNWSAFTSRAVWKDAGWIFHDRQPDFHLIDHDTNPHEAGTRTYVVDSTYFMRNR